MRVAYAICRTFRRPVGMISRMAAPLPAFVSSALPTRTGRLSVYHRRACATDVDGCDVTVAFEQYLRVEKKRRLTNLSLMYVFVKRTVKVT